MQAAGLAGVAAASRRASVRLVVGIIVSLGALVALGVKFQQVTRTEKVLAVRSAVELGEVVGPEDLAVREVSVGDGLATVPTSQRQQIVGQVARAPLLPGELLHPKAVGGPVLVRAGEVAMTLALKEEQAVGGLLRPGDRVALLSTPTSLAGATSTIVLPEVTVLGVRPRRGAGGENDVLVTLRLLQPQAASLQAAYRAGKIDLALVGR